MRLLIIIWCVFKCLDLTQSKNCVSKYFKLLQGNRLVSSPPEKSVAVDIEVMCAMTCLREEWCEAVNLIKRNELQNCELYNAESVTSGQIIKDALSTFYFSLNIEDSANTTQESVLALPTATTLMASSSVSISPSSTTVQAFVTSSATTNSMPAVACKKIFQQNSGASDGSYTIFGGTTIETEVFCDMTGALTGCKGGGWTLVMRIDGNQQTFRYGSDLWNNKDEHQKVHGKTLHSNFETKLSSYHTTPFTEICLGMKYNNKKEWITLPLTSTSLFDLISSNTFHETNLGDVKWKELIPSPSTALQRNCHIEGINVVRGGTGVRIGIVATKTCGNDGDYNSRLGFGAKGTSCGQDGNNRCGNDARCDSVPNANSAKTIGYILVK